MNACEKQCALMVSCANVLSMRICWLAHYKPDFLVISGREH